MKGKDKELDTLLPKGVECSIGEKKIILKPLVWKDYMEIFQELAESLQELSDIKIEKGKVDFQTIVDVISSGKINIPKLLGKITKVEEEYIEKNITLPQMVKIIETIIEQNQWDEVIKKLITLVPTNLQRDKS